MVLLKTEVLMPEGYLAVPHPRDLKGYGNHTLTITIQVKDFDSLTPQDQTYMVLSKINECDCIIDWKTSHSAFKGATEYALGLFNDRFSAKPANLPYHKDGLYFDVTIRTSDLRLYYKIDKTSPKSV